jgi:hypothetical protein
MYVYVGYLKPKKVDELFPWVSDLLASVEGSVHSESHWSAEGTHSLTHSLTHTLVIADFKIVSIIYDCHYRDWYTLE